MKASNQILAIILIVFSSINYISAQSNLEVLSRIDESKDYKELKNQNVVLYAGLQVPEYQREFQPTSNQVGFESGLKLRFENGLHVWENLNLTDDGSVLIALPFEFVFYGVSHNELWINANGNISFNQSVGSFHPEKFPIVVPMIAPFWTDLEATDDDRSGVFVSSEEGSIRILWRNMMINGGNMYDLVSFELILYASENTDSDINSDLRKSHDVGNHVEGEKYIVSGDAENEEPHVYQGQGKNHIVINYLEMPTGNPHHGNGNFFQKYVAGVNSGNGTCGHHAFEVEVNTAVAYVEVDD